MGKKLSAVHAKNKFRFFCGIALGCLASNANADPSYPSHPVQLLVPFAPGGGLDSNARRFAQEFSEQLGQPVVVVNRDGAAGTIGMQQLARSTPDGYNLAFSPAVPLTSEPHRIAKLSYKLQDFQPICQIFDNIFGVVVHKKSADKSINDLLAHARKSPNGVSYGTSGTGSIPHLGIADVEANTGTTFTHIPYKGDGPMLQDLLAERLEFGAMLVSSATAHINNGNLKLIAVFSNKRHPAFPDVPTLLELSVPVEQASFGGLFAPANTPKAVLQHLEEACQKATQSTAYQEWAGKNNQVLDYQGANDFQSRLLRDFELKRNTLQRLSLSN
ncbi:tripartite tricarboxylate transporter substrate binding protein [Bordetella avium]|uniref:Exported protein n=1 Tax=Bordetella avium (strain 197N) TaxID=360910 RepID=Q2L2A3_BORA1|nr:tripartite tricarboxylate transporter substrate binding protein [Bordetella avium]RIQ18452.1 tripartite tricarboxylate transporter substrate binding protein [Bordetella avium]RIQ35511.1 tripartite tricarboxylate transporter substrate binding protein [Bordetella avium]RIQ53910.1 tripartite tricarboxylate transporter substrate binding protein [Bordetella avium]RIQ74231.1 tripartite tricarboxylate transporter substrate binding protein [Bordetella avium]CAJ47621.1 putative exported protein [Bor